VLRLVFASQCLLGAMAVQSSDIVNSYDTDRSYPFASRVHPSLVGYLSSHSVTTLPLLIATTLVAVGLGAIVWLWKSMT